MKFLKLNVWAAIFESRYREFISLPSLDRFEFTDDTVIDDDIMYSKSGETREDFLMRCAKASPTRFFVFRPLISKEYVEDEFLSLLIDGCFSAMTIWIAEGSGSWERWDTIQSFSDAPVWPVDPKTLQGSNPLDLSWTS